MDWNRGKALKQQDEPNKLQLAQLKKKKTQISRPTYQQPKQKQLTSITILDEKIYGF